MDVAFPADGVDDTTAYAGPQDEPAFTDSQDGADDAPESDATHAGRKHLSLEDIKQRDDLVRASVLHLKMTAPQILAFSKTWRHPFYSESDVWRRVKALKIDKRVKHVSLQTLHDEWTLRVFIKLVRDAARNKFPITDISKEHRLGESSGIRADMRLRIGNRLFFLETQHSALTFRSWKAKLTKYLTLYKRRVIGPFRVLIVMENEANLNTVVRYAREVLEGRTNTLFLFAYMPDLLGQYDTVLEDVWTSHKREPVALMR